MKAILTDYDCRFDAHHLGYLRHGIPDKFYKVTPEAFDGRYPYCFAVYDVSMLEGIGSGDGETFVSIRGVKNSIRCDGVAFINDDEDAVEFMTKEHIEDGDNVFGNGKVEEIDVVARREALEKKDKTVKRKIKAAIKKMVKTKQLKPSRPALFDNKTLFADKEDEILALGSYIYRGLDGVKDYIVKKIGIDGNSIQMFTVPEYDYPLFAICLPGNYYDICRDNNAARNLSDYLEEIDCIPPTREHHYVDIDLCWKDHDFEFKEEDVVVKTFHWRPKDAEKLASDRKDIEIMARKGMKIEKQANGDLGLNFLSGVKTEAGLKLIKMICEALNEKFGDTEESLLKKEIRIYSKSMFTKIMNYNKQ